MRHLLVAVLALLAVAPALAQTHSEQITVNVVEVPVHVDRFGFAVEGLTKENFELFVNGEPQRIDYFDAIGDARRGPGAQSAFADAPALHRRRLFMRLFDIESMSHHGIRRAQYQAARSVDEARPGDAFAVATAVSRGVRVVVPFTTDAVAVKRAVQTLRPSEARDVFNIAMLASERAAWDRVSMIARENRLTDASASPLDAPGALRALGDSEGGFAGSRGRAFANDAVNALERMNAEAESDATRSFGRNLGRLAERLAPLSGIKQVVLFSERAPASMFDLHTTAQAMHRKFLASGVVLNAVDAGGLKAPWGIQGAWKAPQLGPSDALYALTAETGGTAALSAEHLRKMESVTYVLGFHPSAPQRKRNSIRVRLRNVPFGTSARHRTSYIAGETAETKDNGLFLADVMLNDIPQHGVTTSVAAAASQRRARVVASIPGTELLALGRETMLDVYLYVFDANDAVSGWSYVRVKLDLEKGRDYLSAQPYTVEKTFDLAPGRYAAKALVRVAGTDDVGFARADVVVPE